MTINLSGSSDIVVEAIQQIALLAASLRLPQTNTFAQSEVSVVPLSQHEFQVVLHDLQPISEGEGCCWHPLFKGSILARGFPIPPRSGQVGVEIPYSVMTSLARVLYPIEFEGGILLKGYSTMLLPTSCTPESIQWHFVSSEGNKRLPTASVKDFNGNWCKTQQIEDVSEKRSFLGYCERVKVTLGTREAKYNSVGYSTYTPKAGRKLELSGFTTNFAFAAHGLPGPILGLNFTLSKTQATIRKNLIYQDYVGMLDDMTKRPLILYDVDAKRSWLVSMISVVLHLMHLCAQRRPALVQFHGKRVRLPFAEASWNGGNAAWKAIDKKKVLELHDNPEGEPYRLMDLVKDIWGNLESAIDNLEEQHTNGYRLQRRRTIRGWELMDMVISSPLNRPQEKEQCIENTGGGWEHLTRHVLTLFCSGLGEIIKPDQESCPGWSATPMNKDYMIASAAMLESLSTTCGRSRRGYLRLTAELCLLQQSKYVVSLFLLNSV